jgi:hypothetical protein
MQSGEAQLVSKSNPTEGVFLSFMLTLLRRVPPFGLAAVPAAASICRVSLGTYLFRHCCALRPGFVGTGEGFPLIHRSSLPWLERLGGVGSKFVAAAVRPR